jgi:hypothetical protein
MDPSQGISNFVYNAAKNSENAFQSCVKEDEVAIWIGNVKEAARRVFLRFNAEKQPAKG